MLLICVDTITLESIAARRFDTIEVAVLTASVAPVDLITPVLADPVLVPIPSTTSSVPNIQVLDSAAEVLRTLRLIIAVLAVV